MNVRIITQSKSQLNEILRIICISRIENLNDYQYNYLLLYPSVCRHLPFKGEKAHSTIQNFFPACSNVCLEHLPLGEGKCR